MARNGSEKLIHGPVCDGIFRVMFEEYPDPIILTDGDGEILSCSHKTVDLLGYTPSELRSMLFYDIVHDDETGQLPELLRNEQQHGGISTEIDVIARDKSIVPCLCRSRILMFDERSYKIIMLKKITATGGMPPYGAAESDRDTISSLLPGIENPDIYSLELDKHGVIVSASPEVLEKTGYTVSDISSVLTIFEIVQEHCRRGLVRALADAAAGNVVEDIECELIAADTAALSVIAMLLPLNGAGRAKVRMTFLDISEHKAAERRLIILEKLRTFGEIAGGVVHDFNNILAVILGFTDMHKTICESEECRKAILCIEQVARDGVELIDRLRNFTQFNDFPEPVPVDLNALILEEIELLRPRLDHEAATREVIVTMNTDLDPIPPIEGNASELREILANFIMNAVDAITGEGTITIATAADDETVIMSIADTGAGMTKAVIDRLFEPFFITKESLGTGLGMSISYGIIDRYGGDISVESEPGKGTVITVVFPLPNNRPVKATNSAYSLTPPAEKAAAAGPSAAFGRKNTSLSILVVDDEQNIREILGEYFESMGHRVVVDVDGDSAAARIASEQFDVVITDLNMPGKNGLEFARIARAASPATTIVLMTGWGQEVISRSKDSHVIDHILDKPIDFKMLTDIINRARSPEPER